VVSCNEDMFCLLDWDAVEDVFGPDEGSDEDDAGTGKRVKVN